jgi:hypothetical protein
VPRQARLDARGTLHHVIIRGIEKRHIVDDRVEKEGLMPPMSASANWAYTFTCDKNLAEMLAVLNRVGPWMWSLRDPDGGDFYLTTIPFDAPVRLYIHVQDPPVDVDGGRRTYSGQLRYDGRLSAANSKYSAELCADKLNSAERQGVDDQFRATVAHLEVRDLVPYIGPYDHQ